MDVQEIIKTAEEIKGNVFVGIVIVLYYLIVYWPKIKDGLGISRNKKLDFEKIEKNYHLWKLRIEIEQLKKNSGLDIDLLERLEDEMLTRQGEFRHKSFTSAQKFFAIPLIIFIVLLTLIELQGINQASEGSIINTLSGSVFVITTIIVGFWGIPVLQSLKQSWIRKTGFVIFWAFGFYILLYFCVYIIFRVVLKLDSVDNTTLGIVLLFSIISSLILGIINRLPFMRLKPEENVDTNNVDL